MNATYRFDAQLWEYPGHAAWHFVTLPQDYADEIQVIAAPFARGFGSVRVEVTINDMTWRTSIFPDAKSGSYFLPIKKAVREACKLSAGDSASLTLILIDLT